MTERFKAKALKYDTYIVPVISVHRHVDWSIMGLLLLDMKLLVSLVQVNPGSIQKLSKSKLQKLQLKNFSKRFVLVFVLTQPAQRQVSKSRNLHSREKRGRECLVCSTLDTRKCSKEVERSRNLCLPSPTF